MNKHTPGPWLFRGKSDSVYTKPPEGSKFTFGDYIFGFRDDEENYPKQADLNLILAAPDLLEALIDCRRALEIGNFTQELAVVDAAIAKATEYAS